jgi:hypothetical protein
MEVVRRLRSGEEERERGERERGGVLKFYFKP